MRYDETENISIKQFTKDFYEEIDSRFFGSIWQIMPWEKTPFDNLIDFELLKGMDALEVGVGCGSHAKLLSSKAKKYTGIDLTEYAVNCTKKRLELYGCKGNVLQMDAENMTFADDSFDVVWSWGVIHHSSNTEKILKEICRVLRPGGKVVTMVYHRSLWNMFIRGGIYYGILKGGFLQGKSVSRLIIFPLRKMLFWEVSLN